MYSMYIILKKVFNSAKIEHDNIFAINNFNWKLDMEPHKQSKSFYKKDVKKNKS